MSNVIKISEDLALYSGDIITLRADDGTFVKRYSQLVGHSALVCYQNHPDEYSNFVVQVVGPDKICLIADNGNYCKRYDQWQNMSIFIMDRNEPDPYSYFVVESKGGNQITLKAENGTFLKRYFGYDGKSVITAYQSAEDQYSIFRVERGGTKCQEVIENVDFDLDKLHKSLSPLVIGEQTLVNNSSLEQTMEFKVSKTVETTNSFQWDYSFQIGVETKFTAGIPRLASNETTVKVETGFTLGGSKSNLDSETFEATFPIICPPNTTLRATAVVNLGKLDVPYIATVSRYLINQNGQKTKYTYKVKGVFRGTNAFNLNHIVGTV